MVSRGLLVELDVDCIRSIQHKLTKTLVSEVFKHSVICTRDILSPVQRVVVVARKHQDISAEPSGAIDRSNKSVKRRHWSITCDC